MRRVGLLALAVLSALLTMASAHAQTLASGSPATAWFKLCEKATAVSKDKDGKEERKDRNICLTHHERLDGNTGMVQVAAAVRQVHGQDAQHLMVMVPLGMSLQRGVRVSIIPHDLWEKVQRNGEIEESDDARVRSLTLAYALCHAAGCTAEIEATPDILVSLKSSGGFVLRTTSESGASIAFPEPLKGFAQALGGEPFDGRTPRTPVRCDQGFWRECSLP